VVSIKRPYDKVRIFVLKRFSANVWVFGSA
jgi:hypothetical protein